jgi:A/G-specific adenine glycosylase
VALRAKPPTLSSRTTARAASIVDPYRSVQRSRIRSVRNALLDWAEREGRHFVWRDADVPPFAILLAEMLLSKTRAEVAEPALRTLLDQFPTPQLLARARVEVLERILYPLGLHRKRARNLVACASVLVEKHGGAVPDRVDELMTLPYVGRYAAHAVASVAFDKPLPVLDANVSRIYQRLFSLPPPPERLSSAHDFWSFADRMLPKKQAKAFNWAILDLGGTVCTAKSPACQRCPVRRSCDLKRSRVAECS